MAADIDFTMTCSGVCHPKEKNCQYDLNKNEWQVQVCPGDGHCLFCCQVGKVDKEEVYVVRQQVTSWLEFIH